jgi:hypothetical protein
MRSWLDEFLRQPHTLPPDPGSGYGRVSLTLPESAVSAAYCQCSVSSALGRIALERLGVPRPTVPQLPRVPAPTTRIIGRQAVWDCAATPQENPSQAGAIAAALIHAFLWMLIIRAWLFLNSRKNKMPKAAGQK